VKCALTRREENLDSGNRNSTIQRLRAGRAADGTLTALEGEFVAALGWDGWLGPTAGPDADALRLRQRQHGRVRRAPEHAADEGVPRPGFVEGTFGLECLIDELAAKLDLDPLEFRRRNYAHSDGDRSYSSKNLMECYERAEKHWERRPRCGRAATRRGSAASARVADLVRRRRPPSYAWIRLGATAARRSSPRCRTSAPARRRRCSRSPPRQLGLPIDARRDLAGDTSRDRTRRSPPARRRSRRWGRPCARAADAARQVIEIAAQRYDKEERTLSLKGGNVVCSDGGSWPLEEVVGCSRRRRSSARAPRAEPDGHVGDDVRRAGRRGRGRRRDRRGARRARRGDPRRRPRDQPARRLVAGRGRDHPGHRPHALRGAAARPETGRTLTQTLDAYKLPTIADVPEIVTELLDVPTGT
jgi:xanthine dehydrogenase YagR molybdenum-binding subunit